MKILNYLLLIIALGFMAIPVVGQQNEVTLGVGDKAPPIQGVTWLKGDPVAAFKKGHVYIVEFGYIGCPGCNIAIPHLSEIAEKYAGKATMISVFYNEKHSRMPRFLESMGEQIRYNVAIDDEIQKTMKNTWLSPAGINYAPSAFIINQQGRIVWIGSPHKGGGIDEVIKETLAGKALEKSVLKRELVAAYNMAARYAKDANKLDIAIRILDRAIKLIPEYFPFYMRKLDYQLRLDERKGLVFGQQLLEKYKNDPVILHRYMSSKFFSLYQGSIIKSPEAWDLVIAINKQAIQADPYTLRTFSMHRDIAMAHFHKKEYKEAIRVMEKAIGSLQKANFNEDELMNGRLEKYLVHTLKRIKEKQLEDKSLMSYEIICKKKLLGCTLSGISCR